MRLVVSATMGGVVLAMLAVLTSTGAAGQQLAPQRLAQQPKALWSKSYSPQLSAADCGQWSLDKNGFCFADDKRNGLEVGVKFTAAEPLLITGVRIYRVDSADITGSLWSADGTLLATGSFAAQQDKAWQDLQFDSPVPITSGVTYIASYHTPRTRYAFEYGFFSDAATTVGPITALRSVKGDRNGVFCYDDQACASFPMRSKRDTNYWVTPLWSEPDASPTSSPSPTTSPPPTVDRKAPRVHASKPANRAGKVQVKVKVKVTFTEKVRRAGVTKKSVQLKLAKSGKKVPVVLAYDAKRHRVVLKPRRPLRHDTKYRVVVATTVRDMAGNRLDQNPAKKGLQKAVWTFRTR